MFWLCVWLFAAWLVGFYCGYNACHEENTPRVLDDVDRSGMDG